MTRYEYAQMLYISIHAPVKGATIYIASFKSRYKDFNPRTREGCDNLYSLI